jgi:2-dehydropantoate 2-reductase
MQFVVIGAGNMGCVYGANLARIGQQVAVIDVWQEHVDRIGSQGLRLEGLTGEFTVHPAATTDPEAAPKADVVLICVNAYSTAQAAATARTVLKETGYCLTLQNGVGNVEILTEVLGTGRVLAGLSFQSGDLVEPGFVRHTNNGPTYLGELDRSRTPRLAELEALFAAAGLNPEVVDDVMATVWAKFVHNCGINALCAITGLRPHEIHAVPELDAFQTGIIEEAVALVEAKCCNTSTGACAPRSMR